MLYFLLVYRLICIRIIQFLVITVEGKLPHRYAIVPTAMYSSRIACTFSASNGRNCLIGQKITIMEMNT